MSSQSSDAGASLPVSCVDVLPRPAPPVRPAGRFRRRVRGPSTRLSTAMVAVFTLGMLPGALVGMATPAGATVGIISAYAGSGMPGSGGDGGPAVDAQLQRPTGIADGPDGSVYVADSDNSRVRRVWPDGTITTLVAGLGGLSGVAVDGVGNVYVAQTGDHVVRRIDGGDATVSTVAGTSGFSGFSGDGGLASAATLFEPNGVEIAENGDLLIADSGNRRVRRVSAATSVISTVAGNGKPGTKGEGGTATSAQLTYPVGVTADASGTFWISDAGNHRVLKVSASILTRFAGTGTYGYTGDGGPATESGLSTPTGLAVGGGSLFIAERDGHRVRRVDAAGIITTVAGTGTAGTTGNGGPATDAMIATPAGLTVTADGDLLEAETGGHVVRSVAGLVPPDPPVLTGSTPGSPGKDTTPLLHGSAPARTTVTLHTDADCTSPAAGTGTAAELAGTGVEVAVAAGSTTTFWARSTSPSGAVSACSGSAVTYTADTTPPDAPVVSGPASPSSEELLRWSFTAEAGSTTTCELTRGAVVVRVRAACSSPVDYDLSADDDGDYVLAVVATDSAGNASAAGTSPVHTLDRQPPAPPTHTTAPVSSASTTHTWEFTVGADAASTRCELRGPSGEVVEPYTTCALSHTVDLTGLAYGDYSLAVVASDLAGNTSPPALSATYTFLSPTDARPVFTRTPAPSDLSWEFTAGGSDTTCVLNGGAATACTTTYALVDPADGSYTLEVTSGGLSASSTYVHDTTPPDAPALTATPPDEGPSSSVSWSFTGTGTRFECALTAGTTAPVHPTGYASCTSPSAYTLATEGTWLFSVVTLDAADNVSAATTDTVVYDATAPAAPTVTGGGVGNVASATWEFDGTGDMRCQLTRGTTVVQGYASCTSPATYSLDLVDDTYRLDVTETDAAGNTSAPGYGEYVLDRTAPAPPLVGRTSPADSVGSSLTPSWSVSGQSGTTLLCTLDQGTRVLDGPAACADSYTASLTGEPDAVYGLVVVARDEAGNTSTATTSSYELDTTVAQPTVTAGQATPSPLRTLSWTVTADPDDTVECRLVPPGGPVPAWGSCPASWTLDPAAADGTYTFQAQVTDSAGNVAEPALLDHVLDSTPPDPPVLTPPASPGTSRTPQVGVDVAPGDSGECAVRRDDGTVLQAFATCTSPWTADLTGQPDGVYALVARAVDAAGNTGPERAALYELLTTAPAAPSFTATPPASTAATPLTWAFALAERSTAQCSIAYDGTPLQAFAACTSPVSEAGTSGAGSYALSVRAVGASGLVGPVVTSTVELATAPAPDTSATPGPAPVAAPSTSPTATATPTATGTPSPTSSASASPTANTAPTKPAPSPTPTATQTAAPVAAGPTASAPSSPVAAAEPVAPAPARVTTPAQAPAPRRSSAGSAVDPLTEPTRAAATAPSRRTTVAVPVAPAQPVLRPTSPAAVPPPAGAVVRDPVAAVDQPGDTAVLSAVATRVGEVGGVFADATRAVLSALSPQSLTDAARAVGSFVRDLDREQVTHAASVAAPKTAFPMSLVLMVLAFLAIQNRIDRNDPKLALAPVYADRHLDFTAPRSPSTLLRGDR